LAHLPRISLENVGEEQSLLGLYWTVSGPVEVHVGREWSLFDWPDRCAEAAKVGFHGLGLWHADIEHQLEQRSLEEMKRIFDDAGLRYLELEFLMDWFLDPGEDARKESDKTRNLLFEAAAATDAHHIKVGNIPGTECPLDQLTERYAELCADAADHTDAKVVYEFMPFDVNVNSVETAMQVVEGAGASNGGVAIDTWHMSKLGIAPDDLRRIPLQYLTWIELSDGRRENMEDLVDETVNHRRLPGEGEFDLRGYVDVAQDMGYPGPWGVEVLSDELRNNPIDVIFRRAYDTTASQFRTQSAVA
jgi:sugar phosphate isomerase/epimerase